MTDPLPIVAATMVVTGLAFWMGWAIRQQEAVLPYLNLPSDIKRAGEIKPEAIGARFGANAPCQPVPSLAFGDPDLDRSLAEVHRTPRRSKRRIPRERAHQQRLHAALRGRA